MIFGFSGGFTEQGLIDLDIAGWGWAYLLVLSLLTEFFGLLTLGLIKPWGEVLPYWVPLVGGHSIPTTPVVAVALTGAVVLTLLWTPLLFWWSIPHPDMTESGANLVGFLYLPLVA